MELEHLPLTNLYLARLPREIRKELSQFLLYSSIKIEAEISYNSKYDLIIMNVSIIILSILGLIYHLYGRINDKQLQRFLLGTDNLYLFPDVLSRQGNQVFIGQNEIDRVQSLVLLEKLERLYQISMSTRNSINNEELNIVL